MVHFWMVTAVAITVKITSYYGATGKHFWNPILPQCCDILGVCWGQIRDFHPPFSKLKKKKQKETTWIQFSMLLSPVWPNTCLPRLPIYGFRLTVFLATPNYHYFLCFKLWSTSWTTSVLFSMQWPCHYLSCYTSLSEFDNYDLSYTNFILKDWHLDALILIDIILNSIE